MPWELSLPRTDHDVCPVIVAIITRRGNGKTTLLAALAPALADPDRERIVSPIGALAEKLPHIVWVQVSASNRDRVEQLFRDWTRTRQCERCGKNHKPHLMVLADEFDELCTQQGYVAPAVYDWVNYSRNQGGGIALCARGTADVTKNVLQNADLVLVGNVTEPNALRYLKDWMHDPVTPDLDYSEVIKSLPPYVFVAWEPQKGRKFQAYVTVDLETMQIREWSPEELGQEAEPTEAPSSTDTSSATTGSTAGSAGSPSPTSPVAGSAQSATTRPDARPTDSVKPKSAHGSGSSARPKR